jgi:hypothetical protein
VQSNFDESAINLIIDKKLIEQQKIKNNLLKIEKNKRIEDEKKTNQSKESWKEAKQNNNSSSNNNNNQKYKKSKYKNYSFNYNQNHSSHYFYQNKKHYKHGKNYKSYNRQKNFYIEREIEFNSRGEIDNEVIEENSSKKNESVSPEFSADSKKNLDVNSQENTEETSIINNLEMLNLNLTKSQSEELNHKNYDLHDVGIKLFPGIYKYKNYNLDIEKNSINNINKKNNININNNEEDDKKVEDMENFVDKNDYINSKNDNKQNYLHKANSNIIKKQEKNGLALAYDYYSSFLEDNKK